MNNPNNIDKVIETLAMAITHSEQGEYAKNEEFVREILNTYRKEVEDSIIQLIEDRMKAHKSHTLDKCLHCISIINELGHIQKFLKPQKLESKE